MEIASNMPQQKQITVGVSAMAPLVIKSKNKYTGFEIELWEKIVNELQLKSVYKEYDFHDILEATKNKEVDLSMGAITMTEEREKIVDFSHHTMKSGLLILISKNTKINLVKFVLDLVVKNFKKIFYFFSLLFLLFIAVGHVMWFIEKDSGAFSSEYTKGILEAIWWTAVTVGTVGYGDYTPFTVLGRTIGVVVILFGIIIFGIYTAEVTSLLTLTKIKYTIASHKDLAGKRVATKEHTTSVEELNKLNAKVVAVKNIEEAYKMLESGKVEAVVFDAPVILHFIKTQKDDKFVIAGDLFAEQNYGFALPEKGNVLRNQINIKILKLFESGEYEALYKKWFGEFRV